MMRLRQLCCHRELIAPCPPPLSIDWEKILRDREDGEGETNTEEEKRMMKQLRDMIRSGVTDDCSICLDDLKSPVITLCGHVFCKNCIEDSCREKPNPVCPLCR